MHGLDARHLSPTLTLALALAAALALAVLPACRSAGAFEVRAASGIDAATGVHAPLAPLRAGAACVEFTPEPGWPLGGYGGGARRQDFPFWFGVGWPGRLAIDLHQWWNGDDPDERADMLAAARGTHDPLCARALVLEAGGAKVALVALDVIAGSERLTDEVLARVADLGFRREGLIVAGTHTHSGPGGFHTERMAKLSGTDNFRAEMLARLVTATAAAIREAHARRRPAEIGFGSALDGGPGGPPAVAENRRAQAFEEISRDATDPEIGIMKVVERGGGRVIAVLVNFAVHPTVLAPDSLYWSADLGGAIARAVEQRLGPDAIAVFMNGAEGDMGPRGGYGGLESARRLGELLAAPIAATLAAIPTSGQVAIAAAWGERDMGDPYVVFSPGDRRDFHDASESGLRWLTFPLTLPFNALLWTLGADGIVVALHPDLSFGARAFLSPYSESDTYRFHALQIRTGSGRRVAIATVPGEALHRVGLRVKALARRRGADGVFFLGLANGALGYIADEEEWDRGGYEATATFYGREAASNAEDALSRCLEATGFTP